MRSFKYLGVVISQGFHFIDHVRSAALRGKFVLHRVASLSGRGWGLDYKTRVLLYKVLVVPLLVYGCEMWCSRLRMRERDILRSAQRLSLIYVSRAYRTAGYAALTAVTGLPPIDMVASMRRAAFLAKSQEDGPSKKVLLERLITEWQAWWDGCERGRHTYQLLPSIPIRLGIKISLDHYVTQVLTGHGDFNFRLHSLGCVPSPLCRFCGQSDTVQHTVLACPVLHPVPVAPTLSPLTCLADFDQLRDWAHFALRRKEGLR